MKPAALVAALNMYQKISPFGPILSYKRKATRYKLFLSTFSFKSCFELCNLLGR